MKRLLTIVVIAMIVTSGCNQVKGCGSNESMWADIIMNEGVLYSVLEKQNVKLAEAAQIGKVENRLEGKACKDHEVQNGDAGQLPQDTGLFSVKGYPKDFLLKADDKLYIAVRNHNAERVKELYPIQDLVQSVAVHDKKKGGSKELKGEELKQFLAAWMPLSLREREMNKSEEELEISILLENGVSFQLLYDPLKHRFSNSDGNKNITQMLKR